MAQRDTENLLAVVVAGDVTRLRVLLGPAGDPAEDAPLDLAHRTTPLMAAPARLRPGCGGGNGPLQCGADPARRDAAGRTAAAYARAAGHPHLAARLDTIVDKEMTMW